MRVRSLLAVFLVASNLSSAAAQARSFVLFEDGFERSEPGRAPAGWHGVRVGPDAVVVAEGAHSGERCARLDLGPGHEKFGNVYSVIRLGYCERSRVVLSAAVRVDGAEDGHAQLWLRFVYDDGETVIADDMDERPIQVGDWAVHRIVADVEAKPGKADYGLMVFDGARAHLDDVRLEDAGPAPLELAPLELAPPRALSERGLANLVAFARLLGIVRYFHPSDEAAEADWDRFAVAGVRRVEGAADASELQRALVELFAPVAPSVVIHLSDEEPTLHRGLLASAGERIVRARAWLHEGLGNPSRPTYSSRRLDEQVRDGALPEGFADPVAPFRTELGTGLACAVPLTLYSFDGGTQPRAQAVLAEPAEDEQLALTGVRQVKHLPVDRATRLAAVVLGWNAFQHFYPYFDVVEVDWPAELERALSAAAEDADVRAFGHTLERMVAALHDGHGGVYPPSLAFDGRLPLDWELVDGELVVTWVNASIADRISAGDVVLELNGAPIAEWLAEIESRTSAPTPQFSRYWVLQQLAQGRPGPAQLSVAMNRAGSILPVGASARAQHAVEGIEYVAWNPLVREPRPGPVEELEPGIWYVDLDAATTEQSLEHLDAIAAARGVVFDMRGYPDGFDVFKFFPHLIREPIESPQWHVPVFRRPDREGVEYVRSNWTVEPAEPYIEAERVFITDGRAISYAETCMGIVEHYQLGEIVGEATAGTNGNSNFFLLPGRFTVAFTGMRVLKQDGSQHHGVGILPTIPVARTKAGIAAGRDELLEAALAVLKD